MDIQALLQGKSQQRNAGISRDGDTVAGRFTRTGQLFTADWYADLVMSGYAYGVTAGDLANAGGDVSLVSQGTVQNSDQPQLAVGIPSGYFGIPLYVNFGGRVDMDADAEVGNVSFFVDTTQTIPLPIAASSTVETPIALLGGAPPSVAYAQSAVTTDITDPVCSQMLAFKAIRAAEFISNGTATNLTNGIVADLNLEWKAPFPMLFRGPCSFIGLWGGTAAVGGAMAFMWAEVPEDRFKV